MAETDTDTELLEEGDIFFLFTPQVNEEAPSGADAVQRFFFALRPRGGPVRLCIAGRKHMPDPDNHERVWGFVETIAKDAKAVEKGLRREDYETETRGEQTQPAARPAGEGVYAITAEDGQMHLSYELEMPDDPGEVQRTLNIAPKASYALSVKNPEAGSPRGAGLKEDEQADYPEDLQEVFRDRRFARECLDLLNYEGAEFVLVGARRDPEREYGVDLEAEEAGYEDADTIRRLRMVKSRHPVKPLFEGAWE